MGGRRRTGWTGRTGRSTAPLIPPHQRLQPQILPRRLPPRLRGALDPEGRVLVRHHVVFVFRVRGLVLGRDGDGVVREGGAGEFLFLGGEGGGKMREVRKLREVDWVRVYQRKDAINVGCDPKDYPTAAYIET